MNLADLFIAKKLAGGGGGGTGTDNYNDLSNKPQINSTALTGDKSASDLGLQSEIDSDNKISADYVDDTSASNKFVSAAEKLAWSGKQDAIDADHKIDADYVDDTTSDNKFVTASDKTAWNAKQNAIDSSHKLSSDLVDDTGHTNLFVTSTEKSTWTGKQDKIDSSHKLSSTLVSFDSSEAAALASGIDSTKVSQIATNQTNILYVLGRTGKNLYDIMHPTRAVNITVTDDGNGQFTQTASGAWAAWDYDFDVTVGTQYTVYIKFKSVTTSNATGAVVLKDADGNDIKRESVNTPQTFEYTFTAPTSRVRLGVTCNNSSYNQTGTFVMQDPMIVEKSIYDNYPDYQPYEGRPNYDLTYLEAQDRAALAEEIDAGAKNKFIPEAGTQAGITAVVNSDNSLNVTWTAIGSSNAYCRINDNNLKLPVGTYVFSGLTESGTLNYYLHLEDSAGNIIGNVAYNTPNRYLEFTVTDATRYYKMYIGVEANASAQSTAKKVYPMICTKAAFGVSQKFVPYRLPYQTLGNLRWKTYEVSLASVSFIKSGGGLYYYYFSVTNDFSEVLSVTIAGFAAVVNKGFSAYMEAGKVGLIVYDATDPQSLAFTSGQIWLKVVGFA